MDENLTEKHSPDHPSQEYAARGAADELVHLVDASPKDVVDPADLHARCGARVLEVYNSGHDVTCERCSAA